MTYYKWIDVAKGIGILLVVVGHAINYLNPENTTATLTLIRDLIYSFHMPLFFFLSGFLLHYTAIPREFMLKKVKKLVIPYFVSYILLSLFLFISYLLIKIPDSFSGFHYFLGMLYGTIVGFIQQTHADILNPLWFLPALFCALLIGYFLLYIFEKDQILGSLSLLVTICIGYVCGLSSIHLPWGFDIAMVAQAFVIPGYYIRKSGYSEIQKVSVFSMGLLLLGFVAAYSLNGPPAMAVGHYNDLFFFFIAALCGVIGICIVSYYLSLSSPIEGILSFFGKNSLIILCFHMLPYTGIHYVGRFLSPRLYGFYFSNLLFEIACMLMVSVLIILIVKHIPFLKRVYYSN